MINVLVVDDSAFMRKKIKEMIESDRQLKVIDTARDGIEAIEKAEKLKPDVITLDVNMPNMDGLKALEIIVNKRIAPVIMLSSLTYDGAKTTFEALDLGAYDFVAKPSGTISLDIEKVKDELIEKIKLAYNADENKKYIVRKDRTNIKKIAGVIKHDAFKAVAIGISTGGPKTIMDVIPYLPRNLNAAVFLVQHMPPNFTAQYANRLNDSSDITVIEASAGMTVEKGVCYVGKGGYHLTLHKSFDEKIRIRLTQNPKHQFMPSVSVMMNSVLNIFGANTIGVLMTGMGDDGADMMVKTKEIGGVTIAESQETAVVFGMPKEAIKRDGADYILPSYEIAEKIIELVGVFEEE